MLTPCKNCSNHCIFCHLAGSGNNLSGLIINIGFISSLGAYRYVPYMIIDTFSGLLKLTAHMKEQLFSIMMICTLTLDMMCCGYPTQLSHLLAVPTSDSTHVIRCMAHTCKAIKHAFFGKILTKYCCSSLSDGKYNSCGRRVIGTPCQRSDSHKPRSVKGSAMYAPYWKR